MSSKQVSKVFGDGTRAVDRLDLEIADGEFMVLVGPSGCGKTTALRMVAGLEEISDGIVRIGDRVVNDLSTKSRDIAMVFQSYALYPHLTVRDNVAFPLKMKRTPRDEIRRRVQEAARILDLEPLLGRKPRALSGGQRQRVAMGRAIVREPAVFLMDEPLSNLDAKLRVQMRADIKRIQAELGVTTIYVTHDQVEAMTMGHRVAVMRKGELQQVAPPQELYDRPRQPLRRRLHRKPGDEHARGADRAYERRPRRGARRDAPGRWTTRRSRGVRRFRRTRAVRSCSGSGRRISTTRRSRTATRARASGAGWRCARRSGRRCSCTSRSPRRRPSPRTSASSRRTSATTAPSASSRRDVRPNEATLVGRFSPRTRVAEGESADIVVDRRALHFFDPQTGQAIPATAMWSDESA